VHIAQKVAHSRAAAAEVFSEGVGINLKVWVSLSTALPELVETLFEVVVDLVTFTSRCLEERR
jgi:hypothetical protein